MHDVQRTDPSYLRWLFGPENCFEDDESPFMWDFDAHWRLFIECQRLCAEHDGQREFRVYARKGQHAETLMMWKLAIRPELTAAFEDKSYILSGVVYFEGLVFADADGAGHYYACRLPLAHAESSTSRSVHP